MFNFVLNYVCYSSQLSTVCGKGCKRNCLKKFDMLTMQERRLGFWQTHPSPEDRRHKIRAHLIGAKSEFNRRSKFNLLSSDNLKFPLCFVVNNVVVCEKAFAFVIGQTDKNGNKSKMWNDEVSIALGKCLIVSLSFL